MKSFKPNDMIRMRGVIYGNPGTGKTTIITSGDPEIYGTVALAAYDYNFGPIAHRSENVRMFQPDNLLSLKAILEPLNVMIQSLVPPPDKRTPEFRDVGTVVIDGLSVLQQSLLQGITDEQIRKSKRTDEYDVQIQDYGAASRMVMNKIRQLSALNMHIFVTLYEVADVDPATGVTTIEPKINNYLREMLQQLMSHQWYTRKVGTAKYQLLTLEKKGYIIKAGNPRLQTALAELTTKGIDDKEKAEKARGWLTIPDANYPTLDVLHKLFVDNI